MANEEQLSILKQGFDVWNKWREENYKAVIDLSGANLQRADLVGCDLSGAKLRQADLRKADLSGVDLTIADLSNANLNGADLRNANIASAHLSNANLIEAYLSGTDLSFATLEGCDFSNAVVDQGGFIELDLSEARGLDEVRHDGPSIISIGTFAWSNGRIPEIFLRGCGLSEWEIEEVKLYNPDLSNDEVNRILYRMYDLRATQALQISPLFISYSHGDSSFVNKVEKQLNAKGVRFWRDVHEMKAGRLEKQIDRAIRQNPTVLLILSKHSLKSDWVEHEVRKARELEKEMKRDVLCPVALDDSWKISGWPKRVMEQVMEYNILDFSAWEDDNKFEKMFRKLIDGLELFYKG